MDITIQFHGVECQLDLFHVAPVELILNFRVGQKHVPHTHIYSGLDDVLDLLHRLLPITRLTLNSLVRRRNISSAFA